MKTTSLTNDSLDGAGTRPVRPMPVRPVRPADTGGGATPSTPTEPTPAPEGGTTDWSSTSARTGDVRLDRGEWMSSTASVASSGLISGSTRIWTTNEFAGFHGSAFPVLLDAEDKVVWPADIDAVKHQYGVDGTWIPGLPSDRTSHWTNTVDAATMARAHSIGLVQYKDPKNMLMRDLELIGQAWKSLEGIVKTFVGGK